MRTPVLVALVGIAIAQIANYELKSIEAEREDHYSAKTIYPVFGNLGKLGDAVNDKTLNWAKSAQAAWVRDVADASKPTSGPYQYAATATVHRHDMRVISLYFTVYDYTGGPRATTTFVCFNHRQENGQASAINIAELFLPGINFNQLLSDQIMAQLQNMERAEWVVDRTVTEIKPAQLRRFTIHEDGLYFLFPPGELAPRSAGEFRVLVPYSMLKDCLDESVLFAR